MSGDPEVRPLFSLEAERSVLGGMLVDPEVTSQVSQWLDERDFYREAHRTLFRAMVATFEASAGLDPVGLAEHLRAAGDFEAVGGTAYLAELWDYVPSAANIEYHAGIVARHAHRRRLVEQASAVQELVRDNPGATPEHLQAEAESAIGAAAPDAARSGNPGFVAVRSLLRDAMEEIERLETMEARELGVFTGLSEVDERLGGMQRGDLVVVAGRPSMGKSAMGVCNIAADAAIRQQRSVAVFSVETSRQALMRRLLGSEARVNMAALRRRRRPLDHEYAQLANASALLNTARLQVDHTEGLTLAQARVKARKLVREFGALDLAVFDYLQLLREPSAKNDYAEVSAISRGLKEFAEEFGCVVVALSQLSRAVEQRPDKRPMLSDLRESGRIEQDADVVMLLYRPEYHFGPRQEIRRGKEKFEINVEGKAEIILAKVREGETGSAHVAWEKEYTHFADFGGGR